MEIINSFLRNVIAGLRTQNGNVKSEFVTATSTAATTTTSERHYNKPILIMTSDRPSRPRPKPFEKVNPRKTGTILGTGIGGESLSSPGGYFGEHPVTEQGISERPHFDYDYYDENDEQFIGKIRAQVSCRVVTFNRIKRRSRGIPVADDANNNKSLIALPSPAASRSFR